MQKTWTKLWSLLPGALFCVGVRAQPVMMKDTRPAPARPQVTVADKERVMAYFEGQQFEDAIDYLGSSLGPDSANISVLSYLGYAYYMTDDHASSEQCYYRVFQLDSLNQGALRYLEMLHAHDDPEAALGYANRLSVLQPERAIWWRTRGELKRRLRQSDSALADLDHGWQIAPLDVKNVLALADLLVERKDYCRADSLLEGALLRDSVNFQVMKLRVRSAYGQKDYARIPELGERAMRLNLPDVNVQSWLALSYYNLQRYTDCIRACEFLVTNGYELEAIYYYEARALTKLHQYKESNVLLSVCLQKAISNTAAWYYNDRGDNFEGLGTPRSAIAQYDTAYYLFKDPLMLYNCGRVAETMKQEGLARRYYARFLAEIKPDTEDEKKVVAYVKRRMRRK